MTLLYSWTIEIFCQTVSRNLWSWMAVARSKAAYTATPWGKTWASYQIRKIEVCAWAGNAGNIFLSCWWRGKRSRHSRRMRNPQCCVSGKRPMPRETQWNTYLTRNGIKTPSGWPYIKTFWPLSTRQELWKFSWNHNTNRPIWQIPQCTFPYPIIHH